MLNFTIDIPTHLQAHSVFAQTDNAIEEKQMRLQGILPCNADIGASLTRRNNGKSKA